MSAWRRGGAPRVLLSQTVDFRAYEEHVEGGPERSSARLIFADECPRCAISLAF
jgi:hypothetical protein